MFSTKSLKNPTLTDHILIYHAFGGCDTTSSSFNEGKSKITTLLKKKRALQMR